MARRAEPYKRMTARNAIPQQPEDEPTTIPEMEKKVYSAPRKNDAAYQSFLKHGAQSRSGKVTASESGARGMAQQGEIDRLKTLKKMSVRAAAIGRRNARREIT